MGKVLAMANVLPRDRQIEVLRLLVEGNSLRSTSRITGVHRTTIQNLLVRFGSQCSEFMDKEFNNLSLTHVEVDEIWTFVQKKQAMLTVEERATASDIGDIYLWTCLDAQTKLIPSFLLGKRSADNARRLMMDLAGKLRMPRPHESDDHAFEQGEYRPVVQISTDGFAAYREAVDLAFGAHVRYGQIIKDYRNADQPGRYAPPEMVATERRNIRGIENVFTICTSHVERHNLTIRTFMKRFTRLSVGFSKKLENLEAACGLFIAYYNYCWRPRFPDRSGKSGRLRVTPAMASKVTDRLWRLEDLFEAAT